MVPQAGPWPASGGNGAAATGDERNGGTDERSRLVRVPATRPAAGDGRGGLDRGECPGRRRIVPRRRGDHVDGTTSADAAASCWEIKQLHPSSPDGIYWLRTETLVRPEQFYCDMTTDGGGWVLIGRGREGWTFRDYGQLTPQNIRETVTGPGAFSPGTTFDLLTWVKEERYLDQSEEDFQRYHARMIRERNDGDTR